MKRLITSILSLLIIVLFSALQAQPPKGTKNTASATPQSSFNQSGPAGPSTGGTGGGTTSGPGSVLTTGTGGSKFPIPANAVTFPHASTGALILTVDSIKGNMSYVSWTLPPGFVPTDGTLTYRNSYDTVSIKPSLTTPIDSISRTLPVGAIEHWHLEFEDSGNIIIDDEVSLDAVYGGVVIIFDDDLPFNIVPDVCVQNNPNVERFWFLRDCLVANEDFICNLSDYYFMHDVYDPSEGVSEPEAYHRFLRNKMNQENASNAPYQGKAYDCLEMGEPDWYTDPLNGGRVANQETLTQVEFDVFPNPFGNRFTLRTHDIDGDATLSVYNLQGQRIHTQQADFIQNQDITINAQSWKPGIYQLMVEHANGRFTQKLIKR
ncbi:MAG: T9SS type A sorting domain-containing protein [Bacteroidia bacterium]